MNEPITEDLIKESIEVKCVETIKSLIDKYKDNEYMT